MAKVNFASILDKVEAYAKSDKGRKRMTAKVKEYHEKGIKQTKAGSRILSYDLMKEAAGIMIELLQEEAAQSMLPQSIRNHFDSLRAGDPIPLGSNSYYIPVYFEDDLSRPSLLITSGRRKGQRTGEGVENIISIFDAGYSTEKQVWGYWEGHPEANRKYGHNDEGGVASKTERVGKYFMEKAVSRFNLDYGREYNAEAVMNDTEHYSLFNSPLESFGVYED